VPKQQILWKQSLILGKHQQPPRDEMPAAVEHRRKSSKWKAAGGIMAAPW